MSAKILPFSLFPRRPQDLPSLEHDSWLSGLEDIRPIESLDSSERTRVDTMDLIIGHMNIALDVVMSNDELSIATAGLISESAAKTASDGLVDGRHQQMIEARVDAAMASQDAFRRAA